MPQHWRGGVLVETPDRKRPNTPALERRVRSREHETSWQSADIAGDEVNDIQSAIITILRAAGPLTDDELHQRYTEQGGSRTPQRIRTERAALVYPKFGQPVVRAAESRGLTKLGNPCNRWELA